MRSLPLALEHYANQIKSLEDCTWHPHPFYRISTVTLAMIGRIVLPGDGGWWGRAGRAPPSRPPPLAPPTSSHLSYPSHYASHPGKAVLWWSSYRVSSIT